MGLQSKNLTDILTFTRASGGTSFRPVSFGPELAGLSSAWQSYGTGISLSGGQMVFTAAPAGQFAMRGTPLAATKIYYIEFTVSAISGGSLSMLISGGAGVIGISTPGTYRATAKSNGADGPYLWVASGTVTAIVTVAICKEVTLDRAGDPIQLFTAPANMPRFDYDPVTGACKGLLVEEQRTNDLLSSNDFTSPSWIKSPSGVGAAPQINPQPVAAPDGTATATRITLTNSGGTYSDWSWVYQNRACVAGTTYCASAYIRASTPADIGKEIIWPGALAFVRVILSAEWRLIENTGAPASSGTQSFGPRIRGVETATTTVTFDIWQAQVEVGAFATSRIPTTGAAATRAADVASVNTLSPWYNPAEGTIAVGFTNTNTDLADRVVFSLHSTSWVNNGMHVRSYTGSTMLANYNGATNDVATTAGVAQANNKLAVGYATNDYAVCMNGAAVGKDTSATVPPVTTLCLGTNGATVQRNGHIKRIQYIPKRLSDAKLQALTTLSYGAPYGPELATGWTAAGVGVAVSGQSVVLTSAGPSTGVGIAGGQLVATKTYVMTMTISGFSSDIGGISFCSGVLNGAGIGAIYTANGTFTQTITAATTETFGIRARNSNVTATVTCSVREATAQ